MSNPGGDAATIRIVMPSGIEELIPGYLASREADIPVMHAALSNGDFERIRGLAHQLKGSGAAYGFAGLTEIGHRLEQCARQASAEAVREQIAALGHYLRHIEIVAPAPGPPAGAGGVVE
jgi:HPt (histidine-containing phosphotransfer) domain-containing protein